jgi:hypothetical protein
MSDNKENDVVRIDLTSEQKEQVKAATDKSADAIELTVQELEARIAPRFSLAIALGHVARSSPRACGPISRGSG